MKTHKFIARVWREGPKRIIKIPEEDWDKIPKSLNIRVTLEAIEA